ncbi:hypothetical protein AZF06_16345 [Priestia endophytica]|uniref:EF-hand domain-containing protein n=1 Tax=Priestia endophytica DSM 13796 TaxID=1121089 RepID=A0A1I6B127_9BACI|nr:hypothetical protein AZF06_16345 [Priestia endophytica]SFQ74626.1 hypothetical protein SAMN02745910_03146 [Priestia endophytica DSM 13796]
MIVNNSGNLSIEYFQLVMNTKQMAKEEARHFIFQRFFHQDPTGRGPITYNNFEKAYQSFNL